MGKYSFAMGDVPEEEKRTPEAQALEDVQIADIIEQGHFDIAAGRYIKGSEAAWAEIEKRAAQEALFDCAIRQGR